MWLGGIIVQGFQGYKEQGIKVQGLSKIIKYRYRIQKSKGTGIRELRKNKNIRIRKLGRVKTRRYGLFKNNKFVKIRARKNKGRIGY